MEEMFTNYECRICGMSFIAEDWEGDCLKEALIAHMNMEHGGVIETESNLKTSDIINKFYKTTVEYLD